MIPVHSRPRRFPFSPRFRRPRFILCRPSVPPFIPSPAACARHSPAGVHVLSLPFVQHSVGRGPNHALQRTEPLDVGGFSVLIMPLFRQPLSLSLSSLGDARDVLPTLESFASSFGLLCVCAYTLAVWCTAVLLFDIHLLPFASGHPQLAQGGRFHVRRFLSGVTLPRFGPGSSSVRRQSRLCVWAGLGVRSFHVLWSFRLFQYSQSVPTHPHRLTTRSSERRAGGPARFLYSASFIASLRR